MQIQLYNTLTKTIEPFKPVHAGEVRMYACGPTVYNFAHIGNMRAFLFNDFLRRVLKVVGGFDVKLVMNITDIDDKTIRSISNESNDWKLEMGEKTDDVRYNLRLFTQFYTNCLIADFARLNIRASDFYAMPNATDFIPQMQELIRKIIDNGFAYERGGSVYFDVKKWRTTDKYGKLVNIDFENFQEGVRIDADGYDREQVSDFVLWKAQKENEPAWDFELNGKNIAGRPGWHIECSAMEFELFGLPFDIHTGGIDLRFPHHEDEIAQSKAGYGIEPTNFWCHNEFLDVEGEKMSKSLGNFYTLSDLIAKGHHPSDIRYLLLSGHYGTRLNFTFSGLESAKKTRARVQEYIYGLHEQAEQGESKQLAEKLQKDVFSELAMDLNSPKALAQLFTFINNFPVKSLNQTEKAEILAVFVKINEIFDVWEIQERPEEKPDEIPAEIRELAQKRWEAKANRNFADADALRKEITEKGYLIKDTKDGYAIEKA